MEIEIKNLKKIYKNGFVLSINNLILNNNSIVGLVGNNGAGKTTLLNCLLDLVKIDEGIVLYGGDDIRKSNNPWKTYTSSFLDKAFLLDFLTIKEYLYFVGSLYNIENKQIDKLLKGYNPFLFDKEKFNSKKYIRALSSGNQQKVGLVAALFVKPKVLLLDEPHTHLDPSGQKLLRDYLENLKKENNSLVILSSHNLSFVSEICDRIILIEEGVIIEDIKTNNETLKKLENYFQNQIKESD